MNNSCTCTEIKFASWFLSRLHEFDEQVQAVREGMAKVVPVPLLSLFSGYELETMVCGSPDIPLNLLKSVATYKGINSYEDLICTYSHWHISFDLFQFYKENFIIIIIIIL